MRDRMLRIAAEFENYKKRTRKEQADGESKVRESVLKDMLEVADNLERASAAVGGRADIKALQQGVALVLRLFQQQAGALRRQGRWRPRASPSIRACTTPSRRCPAADVPPGSVLNEVQKGYSIGDRLLRPALVVVAVAPPRRPSGSNGSAPTAATRATDEASQRAGSPGP